MLLQGYFTILLLVIKVYSILVLLLNFYFVEWYWKCLLYGYTQKVLAVLAGILSAIVVWSEVTFFNKEPVLSIFAIIVNVARNSYDYFKIEVKCLVTKIF